jgi:hypothetical protein
VAGGDELEFDGFGTGGELRFGGYHRIYAGDGSFTLDSSKHYYDLFDAGGAYEGSLFINTGSATQLVRDVDYFFS